MLYFLLQLLYLRTLLSLVLGMNRTSCAAYLGKSDLHRSHASMRMCYYVCLSLPKDPCNTCAPCATQVLLLGQALTSQVLRR